MGRRYARFALRSDDDWEPFCSKCDDTGCRLCEERDDMSFHKLFEGDEVIVTAERAGEGWRWFAPARPSGPAAVAPEFVPNKELAAELEDLANEGHEKIRIRRRGTNLAPRYECSGLVDEDGPLPYESAHTSTARTVVEGRRDTMTIVDRYEEIRSQLNDDSAEGKLVAAIFTAGEAAGMADFDDTPSDRFVAPSEEELDAMIDEDDEEESDWPRPRLKGRQPVSLLQEVCQERGLPMPEYEIHRAGGEDHIPHFGGIVKLTIEGVDRTSKSETKYRAKADAKKALARKMLVEHFEALL